MRMETVRDDLTEIHATLYCERESHKRIIIGKQGSMLKAIGSEARIDIEKLLGTRINLQLWVKVRPDWRNNVSDLKALGYES
jgi:GTP-binding protein Era